jgi:hypothetical protein
MNSLGHLAGVHRCRAQPLLGFVDVNSKRNVGASVDIGGLWVIAAVLFVGVEALELRSSNAWSFHALVSWR